MTKCMLYREGEIDSPFSQQNQRAYCVSICEVQILMQHRSRFFIFSTRIQTIYAFIGSVSRDAFNEHRKSEVLPIKSKTLICAQSGQSLPLSYTDNLGA